MENTAVFILSSNYSGSTWLALLLGSNKDAFYVGELNKMFHDEPVPCRLCEDRGVTCPVFYDIPNLKNKNIHDTAFQRSGKPVLIDNSKTLAWSRKFLADKRFARKYVHLLRDPRAVAFSLQNRDKPPKVDGWVKKNTEIHEFLLKNELDYKVVTYNDVAEKTDAVISDVSDWLGVKYDPAQKEYWNFEHHGPGRNGATSSFLKSYVASDDNFYAQNQKKQFHDLRWRDDLVPEIRAEIENSEKVAGLLKKFDLKFTEIGLE